MREQDVCWYGRGVSGTKQRLLQGGLSDVSLDIQFRC